MNERPSDYHFESTKKEEIPVVIELLQTEKKAVVIPTPQELEERIDQGLSIVAKDESGTIVGHQGAMIWKQSGIPEIGSAVVLPEHRRKGLSTWMKKQIIKKLQDEDPNTDITSFTGAESESRGILQKLGFEILPMKDVPSEFFSICSKDKLSCYDKIKQDPPACKCIVFILKSKKEK